MFALKNGIRLHFKVEGQAQGTPLVFINSLGCDLHIWDKVIPSFTGRYRILRYDKRGHGLSDVPPGPYTIRDHTEDLAVLLNDLEVDKAILTGISVGGLIAMDFALQYPSRVRTLVLADTAPRIGTPEGWNERIAGVRARGLDGMAETIVGRWFLPSFPRAHPDEYRQAIEMLSRASPDGYTATCAALRDADLSSSIQSILAPTLVLCGARDQVVTPEQTRAWAASLPKGRVVMIEGAAHLPCIEQPGAVANAIGQFLQETSYE